MHIQRIVYCPIKLWDRIHKWWLSNASCRSHDNDNMVDVLSYVRITFNSRKINIYLNGIPAQYVISDTANASFLGIAVLREYHYVALCTL